MVQATYSLKAFLKALFSTVCMKNIGLYSAIHFEFCIFASNPLKTIYHDKH